MSRRYRQRRHHQRTGRVVLAALAASLLSVLLVLTLGGGAIAYTYADRSLQDLPDLDDPALFRLALPTKVYSADGKLLANFHLENREVVKLSKIATDLVDAVIAVEDERFYKHTGVDIGRYRTRRRDRPHDGDHARGRVDDHAAVHPQHHPAWTSATRSPSVASSARPTSPGTREAAQQGRDPRDVPERRVLRRRSLRRRGGRQDLLRQVGEHAHSGRSHAPRGPPAVSATAQPVRQHGGRSRSAATGPRSHGRERLHLTGARERRRRREDRAEDDRRPNQGIYDCEYFVSYVRKQLLARYQDELVFKGGLKVYTTIDTRLQRYAEAAVKGVLRTGAIPTRLCLDRPAQRLHRGDVRRQELREEPLQHRDARPAATGLGVQDLRPGHGARVGHPAEPADRLVSPAVIPTHPPWRVTTPRAAARRHHAGEATRNSVNVVFARLIWEIGPRRWRAPPSAWASRRPSQPPAIALGSAPVTPLEMASAYGTLAPAASTTSRHRSPRSSTGRQRDLRRTRCGKRVLSKPDRMGRHATAHGRRPAGDRDARRARRPRGRRQDRDGAELPGRLVLRLHAAAGPRRCGWATCAGRSRCATCTASARSAGRSARRCGTTTPQPLCGARRLSDSRGPTRRTTCGRPTGRRSPRREHVVIGQDRHADEDEAQAHAGDTGGVAERQAEAARLVAEARRAVAARRAMAAAAAGAAVRRPEAAPRARSRVTIVACPEPPSLSADPMVESTARGGVAERLKATVLKLSRGNPSQVRILPPPPTENRMKRASTDRPWTPFIVVCATRISPTTCPVVNPNVRCGVSDHLDGGR